MRKFLLVLGLCVVCYAAPTPEEPKRVGLVRPSPINPHVVSDPKPDEKVVLLTQQREKRDESTTGKPSTDAVFKSQQHDLHRVQLEKQIGGIGHDIIQPDPKKLKREALHEAGHDESAPEKPHSVVAHESLQHKPTPVVGALHDAKKLKREAHHEAGHDESAPEKPHSVVAHESLQHKPTTHTPTPVVGALHDAHKSKREAHHDEITPEAPYYTEPEDVVQHKPTIQPGAQHDSKKVKREAPSKIAGTGEPHVVVPDAHAHQKETPTKPELLVAHDLKKTKRETESKVAEVKSTTVDADKPQVEDLHTHVPDGPLRHHPVPVAELFGKAKSTPKPSSGETDTTA